MKKFFTHPNFPREVTPEEYEALRQLIESRGWAVYLELKREEQGAAIAQGMSGAVSEEDRAAARGVFAARSDDLVFAEAVLEAQTTTERVGA